MAVSSDQVLLVDDDTVFLRSLKATLIARGYNVVACTDPYAAAHVFDVCLVRAVVLDLHLGQANALNLLNELASYDDTARIPKVILSSSGHELSLHDLKVYGVVGVLDKRTYNIDQLCQLI